MRLSRSLGKYVLTDRHKFFFVRTVCIKHKQSKKLNLWKSTHSFCSSSCRLASLPGIDRYKPFLAYIENVVRASVTSPHPLPPWQSTLGANMPTGRKSFLFHFFSKLKACAVENKPLYLERKGNGRFDFRFLFDSTEAARMEKEETSLVCRNEGYRVRVGLLGGSG